MLVRIYFDQLFNFIFNSYLFSEIRSIDSLLDTSDDENIFNSRTDEMVKLSYRKNLEKFTGNLNTVSRQLQMLHSVARNCLVPPLSLHLDKYEKEQLEKRLRKLTAMKNTIDRRTAAGKPHFGILFELYRFLDNCPSNLLISMSSQMKDFIESWILNPCFESQFFEEFVFYLRNFYEDDNSDNLPISRSTDLKAIYRYYKYSRFWDEDTFEEESRSRENFFGPVYFSIILQKFDEKIREYTHQVPGLIELARTNLPFLQIFLEKFEIPFSGPYKSSHGGRKFLFFISAINPGDSIINKQVPLYGVYEFDLSAYSQIDLDDVINFWEKLETAPFWLMHVPPLFNLTLANIRDRMKMSTQLSNNETVKRIGRKTTLI